MENRARGILIWVIGQVWPVRPRPSKRASTHSAGSQGSWRGAQNTLKQASTPYSESASSYQKHSEGYFLKILMWRIFFHNRCELHSRKVFHRQNGASFPG